MFRVSTFWWMYKRAKPFPSPLIFLEFLCHESYLHIHIRFSRSSRWLLHGHHLYTLHVHSFFAVQYTWEFHLSLLLCIMCVCVCVCISFWLINFYLWLVLVFLFSRVSYGFTPLRHCMSRHYTSRHKVMWYFQCFW